MLSTEKTDKTEIFSTKEREEIIQKIFYQKEIDSAFLYKGNGGEFYNKILESGKYRAYTQESELIDKYRQELQKYIKKYLTDIGCGNGEKAINLLKDHNLINNIFYIASDYSASLIELAEKNIKTNLPNLNMGNHQIMRGGNELFTNNLDDNTYARLGCTIGNSANKRKIIEDIKNMNNSGTLKGNKIIFSYFDIPQTSEEIEKTKALYQNPEGKDFIFNGLQNLGIDTSKFDHIVDYNELDKCIYISIQAKEDYSINFKNGQEIRIKKGEKFKIHKSQRFSLEDIKDILKQSGAKLEKHISEDGISMIVAKKDPKYYKKTMKIIGFTSLFLLAVLGGAVLYKTIDNNKKKEKAEEIAREKIKEYDINFRIDGHKALYITSLKEKEIYLQNIAESFSSAYGTGKLNQQNIYYMIVDSYGPNSFTYQTYGKDKFQKFNFINRQLIPNNEVELQNSGIDLDPYKDLSEYEDAIINSRSDTTNTNPQHSQVEINRGGGLTDPTEINKIGEYTTIHGTTYEIGYITRNREPLKNKNHYSGDFSMGKYKRYLVAKLKNAKELGLYEKFSVKNAKTICEDYFLRTRPQIQTTYDIIKICCKSKNGYYTDQQIDNLQGLILNYFIKNQTPRDSASKYGDQVYPTDLLDFIYNKLLKDQSNNLKKIGIDPVPYSVFYEFIDAFQNTQEYRDLGNQARGKNDFLAPDYKELTEYNEKYIGEYINEDGEAFGVSYITVKGKRYIIANERNDKYSNGESCIIYGTQVREDFQKNRLNKK